MLSHLKDSVEDGGKKKANLMMKEEEGRSFKDTPLSEKKKKTEKEKKSL